MHRSCLVSLAAGILLLPLVSLTHARTWTSADGRTLEAELVAYDATAGTVKIKRKDGKEFTLRKSTLSEAGKAMKWIEEEQR